MFLLSGLLAWRRGRRRRRMEDAMSTNPLALTAAEQGQTAGRHQREAAEQSKLAVQQALEIAAIRARVQGER